MKDLEKYETCGCCKQRISSNEMEDEQIIAMTSTECYHIVHRECLKNHSKL